MEKLGKILKSLVIGIVLMTGLSALSQPAAAQSSYIKGSLCDSLTLAPMPGVVVELLDRDSTTVHYVTSGEDGGFSFSNLDARSYILRCTILGYVPKYLGLKDSGDIGLITMTEDPLVLQAAVAEEQAIRTSQSGDTLTYSAAAYKTVLGSSSEDLLSKMPGISVNTREVEANGRKVTRIMVDGKEYFADDVMTALRNVPADIISEIEVVNKLSDESEVSQMDDGDNNAAINIVTKKRKNKQKGGTLTGRFYGGYGIPDKYIGGGNVNWFGEKNSATVLAMANNISRYNFVSDDLVSASSTDANTAGKDFSVQPLPGLSSVQSAGGNFTNSWFTGSYLFNRIDNANLSENFSRRRLPDNRYQVNTGANDFEALNLVHRFSSKMNWRKGRHSVIFRPTFNWQDLNGERYQTTRVYREELEEIPEEFLYNRINSNSSKRSILRAGGRLVYGYRFAKPGRSITASIYGNYIQSTGNELSSNWTLRREEAGFDPEQATSRYSLTRDRNTRNYDAGGSFSYMEPLGKGSRLSLDYRVNYRNDWADNLTFVKDKQDPRQSAVNENGFLNNTAGVRYGFYRKKISITASLNYQHVDYDGSAELPYAYKVDRHFDDVLYSLVAKIPFNRENTLRIDARSWTRNPSVSMMQDVVNLNNPSFIRAGNPDILPSYMHKVYTRYLHTNRKKGSTLSLALNVEASRNFIGDSLVVDTPDFVVAEDVLLGEGNQYSKPINLGGYYKVNTKFTYGFPIRFLSSNFNINAHASWSAVPGMINGDRVPVHRDRYSLLLKLDSNVSEFLDFSLSYDAGYSSNEYSNANGKMQNNFVIQNARGRVKWIFWKGMTLTGSAHWENHWNTDGRYNDHMVFCDLFLGKRLFRNQLGEISIGCNDIFNHTAKVYRHNISPSGSSDLVNQGVGRYFSIQFVYHLRKM